MRPASVRRHLHAEPAEQAFLLMAMPEVNGRCRAPAPEARSVAGAARGPAVTKESEYSARPWRPTADPTELRHLGKLGEELGELTAAVARCIIQGIDECEPETGKPNRQWLSEEIADVMACLELASAHLRLDEATIRERAARKVELLSGWHWTSGR
jgi:NTP pyrophosphatase (non-canonical NTP hydrolase)